MTPWKQISNDMKNEFSFFPRYDKSLSFRTWLNSSKFSRPSATSCIFGAAFCFTLVQNYKNISWHSVPAFSNVYSSYFGECYYTFAFELNVNEIQTIFLYLFFGMETYLILHFIIRDECWTSNNVRYFFVLSSKTSMLKYAMKE